MQEDTAVRFNDCSEEGAGSWTCTWRYEGDEVKKLKVVWVGELLSSMVQMLLHTGRVSGLIRTLVHHS